MLAWAALMLSACSGPPPTPPLTPAATGPITGGTIRIGIPTDNIPGTFLETVHDWLDSAGGGQVLWFHRCCVSRTLLSYRVTNAAVGGSELVPDLASDLPTVSSDGLTWEFHLRAGLHYAPPYQGAVITAAEIVRGIEAASVNNQLWSTIVGADEFLDDPTGGIAGLEAPNATTLRIRLTEPDGDFPHRMAFPGASPIPAAALLPDGHPWAVSSGPYVLDEKSTSNTEAILVRNPSWSRSTDPLRPAYADRIELVPVESAAKGLALVESGDIDLVTSFLTPQQYDKAQREQAESLIVSAEQDDAIFYLPMNVANPPMDDVHVRRAVALLIDRQAITKSMQGTRGSLFDVADHFLPNVAVNGLLSDYDPLAAAGDSGNVAAAQQEMRLSRYDTDGDGRCDHAVCDHIVIVPFFDSEKPAELIADELPALGMTPVIKQLEDFPRPQDGYHLLAVAGWGGFGPIATEFTGLVESTGIAGAANLTLLGATRAELRRWGYPGTVPSLDTEVQFCREHRGSSAFRCWAELDQLVMEQLVPLVPVATRLVAFRISGRIDAVEMSRTEGLPAIDTMRVKADAAPTS